MSLGVEQWVFQAETARFRYKTLFGEQLNNHVFKHRATEALVRCRAMNIMTCLGMPDSYTVTLWSTWDRGAFFYE